MNNNTGSYENPMFLNYSEMYQQKLNLEANNTALRNENAAWQYQNATLQSQNENLTNAYNAVVERANGMHLADANTIARLTGTIASMKAARELSSRRFENAGNDIYYCIEPSGKKKEVGYLNIKEVVLLTTIVNNQKRDYLSVLYEVEIGREQLAVILIDDIGTSKIINYFHLFNYKCIKEIAIGCIRHILLELIKSHPGVLEFPEYPGIQLKDDGNGNISAEFMCLEQKLPAEFKKAVSWTYYNQLLPRVYNTPDTIAKNIDSIIGLHDSLFMIIWGLIGILSPWFKRCHYDVNLILTVSCVGLEGEQLTNCILNTYSRNKQSISLTSTVTDISNFLENCYGESVVFNDDTVSENCGKRRNAIDAVVSHISSTWCNPFSIAIISNETQYIIPNEKGILIETDFDFGKGFSEKDRYELASALDEMTRYFGETFCRYSEYGSMLKASIDRITSECRDDFSSSTLCNAFAVLYSVYIVWCSIFNVHPDESFKEYSKKLIINSQDIKTGKDYLVVNSFFKVINSLIAEKKVSVKKLGRQMNYVEDSDTIIIDGDTMLIEESVVKRLILPKVTEAQTVNGILTALNNQGFLISTNGNKKPTTVYDCDGTPIITSLIAFKYSDMIGIEIIRYIDSLSCKQYFTDDCSNSDFLPLVHNGFGGYAGQMIVSRENQHRCITGKSGSGKTVFLMQLMARLGLNGNRVVVFDSSNSFTKDELEGTLSKQFIEEHITFYDVSEHGLPVHLLHTYKEDTPTKQRNMLVSIISEAMHGATQLQISFLKKVIKEYMNMSYCSYNDFYDMFSCIDLNESEKKTRDAVLNKIGQVFEDIIDNNEDVHKNNWNSLLEKGKEIIVINIDESEGSNGHQLTDLLIASLFYAQLHQSEYSNLCIFIDEIQNQNLSDGSIITKIMREGRKYSIGLNFATQYIDKRKESRILRQASLNVCFRPDNSSRNAIADMLGFSKKDAWKLDMMEVGECFIQGNFMNFETGERDETVIRGKTLLLPDSPLNNTK